MIGSIVVALVTAIATTAVAEGIRAFRNYVDRRNRIAEWNIRVLPPITSKIGRFFVVENVGNADALDVHVTITGDAKYEVNAGAPLDVLRPRDTFLVLVHEAGNGTVLINWKDRQGKKHGPAHRALAPE